MLIQTRSLLALALLRIRLVSVSSPHSSYLAMSTKHSAADSASTSAQEIAGHFLSSYKKTTSKTVQLIDYFLVFALLTGVVQFIYVLLVGQFPFNSFLAGFVAAVGFFVFTGQPLRPWRMALPCWSDDGR